MAKRIIDEEMRFSIIINGDPAQKELHEVTKATEDLVRSNQKLRTEKERLERQNKTETARYKEVTAEMDKNTASIQKNYERMDVLEKQIGVTGLTMQQLRKKAAQLRTAITRMSPKDPNRAILIAELERVNAQLSKVSLRSRAAGSALSKLSAGFNKYAAIGASAIATVTGLVISFQKLTDIHGKLSDAQADVQKTTGLSKRQVDDLTRSIGMFETRTARIELLELAEEAGRLGKDSVEDVMAFVRVANKLKVALGDELTTEQIREVGKMSEVYQVAAKNGMTYEKALESLGSAINEVSASGANQASFLVDYLKRAAGISIQTNVSAQDNIAYAATFDEIGQSVEVSATAMNKVWMDMFQNTDAYAKIAGMSIKDFTVLMNTDANAAMIKFLKGLNGNNEGLSVLGERLKDLEVGGARGVQALAALSANTELLETRQKTANEALAEGTSLTNEYEIKNNNLAATVAKVEKAILAAFSSKAIVGAISALVGQFALLIGAVSNVDEAFKKETKSMAESTKANMDLALESGKLLNRYEELVADGVEPSIEAKHEMDVITLKLRDSLGESVTAIDKETGALILNTQEVRKRINMLRISADQEASMFVSRKQGVLIELEDLEKVRKQKEAAYDALKRDFETKNKVDLEAMKNSNALNAMEKQQLIERLDGYKLLDKARGEFQKVNADIEEQKRRELEIDKELKKINISQEAVRQFFGTDAVAPEETAKVEEATPFEYTEKEKKGRDTAAKKRADQLKKESEALLKLQRESEDNHLAMIQDAFTREMQINDVNHLRKMEDLQRKTEENQKLADQALLSGDTNLASKYVDQNMELFTQMEQAEQQHQAKRNEILQKGIENHIKTIQEQYDREEQEREIAHNNELAALGNNEKAKEALQDQYNEEKLQRQKANELLLIAELEKILDTSKFEGFSLDVLTDEQLKSIQDNLRKLGLSISEINALLAKMSGSEEVDILGTTRGNIDVLGFSVDDWELTFENLDQTKAKMEAVVMTATAMLNAYSMFSEFQSNSEKRRIQQMEKNTSLEKDKQARLLENKFISQKQHDDAVKNLDKELEKRKAEIAYKQAKREKAMAISNIAIQTGQAIMGIWAQVPKFDFGISAGILTGVVSALGAVQMAMVASQPLPAKGFEQGYGMVRREQDGKLFNAAFGGESRSGVVDKPTVFLAGEGGKNFPEMIIDGRTLKQFNPDLKNSLYRELGRIKGFENGHYNKDVYQVPAETQDNGYTSLAIALNRNSEILERLEQNGVIAYMSKDLANIKKMRDELERLQKLENKAKINT